jgi:hypothetical protein
MLLHLGIAVLALLVLVAGWLAVQALARRSRPDAQDEEDVLACGLCSVTRQCHCGKLARSAPPPGRAPGSARRRS